MKQTQTHARSPAGEEAVAYSLARRKAAAVTRESGEIDGREKATAVTCTWAAPGAGQRENNETVAKQKQPPSAFSRPRYHARGARAAGRSREY